MGLTILDLLGRAFLSDWTILATILAGVVSIPWIVLYTTQRTKKHRDEPPIIPSTIPYIGHLLGMALFGGRYIKNIGLQNPTKPIFTLPLPFGSRLYIITSPALAAAVQRASRTLSFSPLVPDLTRRILGFSPATAAVIATNLDPAPGEPSGLLADLNHMVYAHLGPGEDLAALTKTAARGLAAHVNAYAAEHDRDPETGVELLGWLRGFVVEGTAGWLYGAENPIAVEGGLEEDFWAFDHGIGGLLVGGPWAGVTARRAWKGRERLVQGFGRYLEEGRHRGEGVAEIVKRRVEILETHGLPMGEVARSEVSFLFANIVNTATTAFWVVTHLYARPALLRRVRAELLAGGVTELDLGGGKPTRLLDLEAVKAGRASPTLGAVFREALRTGSDNYSTRLVKEDTVLAGRWWMGKGAVVQIAGGVIHADEKIWGEGAEEFDPVRFLKLDEEEGSGSGKGEEEKKKVHPAAFRAFGGGKTLCPGRHFATYEILAFAAMIVLTFDLEAVDEKGKAGGKIVVPAKEDGVLPVHILEPKTAVKVKVRVREDGGEIVIV